MSDEYGNDFVTITDDDGNVYELEHLDAVEIDGELFMAFVPADMDEDDEKFGLIILKVITQDNEEIFSVVEDEAELQELFEIFAERLSEDDEYDEDDDFDEETVVLLEETEE